MKSAPTAPNSSAPKMQPAKPKMSKKEKRFMWAGVVFITPVVLFILFFVLLPHITALIKHCNIDFSGSSASCGSTNAAFVFLSIPIGIFIATPLAIIGSLFLLYSILSWKKIKSPGLTAFLSVLLATIILVLLAFGFVSILAFT